jgi:type IV secretion system protein VirD4
MVPEEKLTIYRGFMRAVIGCALIAMTRQKRQMPKIKTLLLLDEAAALGRLQPIEDGVGFLATYMSMIMVWQDLDQLERTYSRARSIIANAGCKVAFNVSDIETARMLADSIGYATVQSHSSNVSQSNVDPVRQNLSQGLSEAARYLLDPAEIMRLPDHLALILMPRQLPYPVLARKVRYWTERCWRGLWDSWRVQGT